MSSASKCTICSATTQSWRYQALACNVCANFFRRNVLKKRERMQCNNGGLLEIRDCFEQRRCHSCRLKLCLVMGMSEDVVRFNAESRRVAKERRLAMDSEKSDGDKHIMQRNPEVPEIVIDRVIANLRRIEDAFERLRKSKFSPLPGSIRTLKEALSGSSKLSIDYGETQWARGYPEGYTNDDGSMLDNIYRRIRIGLARENYEDNRKSWFFSSVIFAIEYFKVFDVFNHLSTATRTILAGKMVFLCTHFTNLMYSIRAGNSHLVYPDGMALFAGMQHSERFSDARGRTAEWMQSVREMQLDENECAVLKVLLILSPSLEDASTSDRALLTRHRESFAKILFSYVIAKRGCDSGPRCFQEMLALIETINRKVKVEKDVQVFAIGMFREMCPLLAEIISI